MSSESLSDYRFYALHAMRVSSFSVGDSPELRELGARGLARPHETAGRQGWVLTTKGLGVHASELTRRRTPELAAVVERAYDEFLAVNREFKELCTDWQTAGAVDPHARDAFVAELGSVCGAVRAALAGAALQAPWLERYMLRFERALEKVNAGDDAYLTSPIVESVHTVWAEAHEDFLVTLARERSEADE